VAEIKPIRAWRYNDQIINDIGLVTAPLFDVVSEKQRIALYQNPLNSIHLSVPKPPDAANKAKKLLSSWKNDGVIVQDKLPAIYVYYQYFKLAGDSTEKCRKGFVCHIRTYPFEENVILRHENTIPQSVNDRIELLAIEPDLVARISAILSNKRICQALEGTRRLFEVGKMRKGAQRLGFIADRTARVAALIAGVVYRHDDPGLCGSQGHRATSRRSHGERTPRRRRVPHRETRRRRRRHRRRAVVTVARGGRKVSRDTDHEQPDPDCDCLTAGTTDYADYAD